ncbi:hypothetical protein AGMMS49949_02030 [Alphaproteobacteria bacterium]|nr:hypothetical protein AGMMS49949_02030 [Alphaproteobacteria bacterium]GHS95886.1 hypothetical protein AGMMS50296_1310 [Alphaproteobacteria bacterium]
MLQQIRERSGSLVIKIILCIIGISFFAFGIMDVVRILTSTPPVARGAHIKVPFQEFYSSYQRYTRQTKKENQALSSDEREQAAQMIAESLAQDAILKREPKKLGLVVPKDVIKSYIRGIPTFQKDGKFDADLFNHVLQQAGISSGQFIADVEAQLMQQQLLLPVLSGIHINPFYKDLLLETLIQKKSFEILIAPETNIQVDDPSPKVLENWVETNKEKYSVSEKRDVELILFDHETFEATIPVSKEELQLAFETQKDDSETPEKRDVTLVTCKTDRDAELVKKLLLKKTAPDTVKKKLPGVTLEKFVMIEKKDLPGNDSDSVFSLAEGESFGPVRLEKGFGVYVVTKIERPRGKTLQEMTPLLEKEIRTRKGSVQLSETKEKIEDAFASGQTFEEISKEFPLKKITLARSDEENFLEKAKENNLSDPVQEAVKKLAFSLEKDAESEFLDGEGASFIVKVVEVHPKHLPDISQIKETAIKDYREHIRKEKISERCIDTFGKVNVDIEEWDRLLKKNKFKPKNIAVSRFDLGTKDHEITKMFTPDILERLMLQKKNKVEFFETLDGHIAVVFLREVRQNIFGSLDPENIEKQKAIAKNLEESAQEEALKLFKDGLLVSCKIVFNKKVMEKVYKKVEDS